MIYLIELTAATDSSGTTTVLRATSAAFYATKPSDTPANTLYLPRVQTAGMFKRDIASPGRIYGATTVGYGYVQLANADGALDGWLAYSFAGRQCRILIGEEGAAYSTFTVILTGTMDKLEFPSLNTIRIRIRDRLHELDKILLTTKYAGSNSLPSGLEGVDDLKDKFKPRIYGYPRLIEPPCVNTSRLIYQLSDKSIYAVINVRDSGATLTAGSTYSSQSDMETNAPSAGQYRAWLPGGMIRLGSTPAGRVTVNAHEHDIVTATTGCPASLISEVAQDAGIASGDINSSDVSSLNTAATYRQSGYYLGIDDQSTALQVMDYLASSVGAWYGFDRLGDLRMAQLVAPDAGDSVYTFEDYEIFSIAIVTSEDGGAGVPVWSATARYLRNWSPMNEGEIAGSVTLDARVLLKAPWLKATYSDSSIKTQHLLAEEIEFDTAMLQKADALAEAQRREELLEIDRRLYSVRARVLASMMSVIDLGVTVQVNVSRYGMSSKAFIVTGILHDPLKQVSDLTLWG